MFFAPPLQQRGIDYLRSQPIGLHGAPYSFKGSSVGDVVTEKVVLLSKAEWVLVRT